MTKREIDLIVGWLCDPDTFDFMIDQNRELLAKAGRELSAIVADKKRLFWAVPVNFLDRTFTQAQIVEVSAYQMSDGEIKLQVMCIGEDSVYKYNDFHDYLPIAAPPVKGLTSPS